MRKMTQYHVEHPEKGFVSGPYGSSAPATALVNRARRSRYETERLRAADYYIVATTYEEVERTMYIPKSWQKAGMA